MVSVKEAMKALASHPLKMEKERVPIDQALGRILAEPIRADRDFPPYDRVTMDGIALHSEVMQGGKTRIAVEAIAPAGHPEYSLADLSKCVEVMTGAVLPKGSDTVIRYENITISDGWATVNQMEKPGSNVHRKGQDRKAGSEIVSCGTEVSAAELGIAATVGMAELTVWGVPSIALVSTGDELVPIDARPLPHQIRSSNIYSLMGLLSPCYTDVHLAHLPDNQELVVEALRDLVEKFEVIILIGGSSAGKYDFIPDSLEKIGIKRHFYKVAQRPGKPFWFGHRDNRFVFALPGNPVSCFVCLKKYFMYWLKNSLEVPNSSLSAALTASFSFSPDLCYFLPVRLANRDGLYLATPSPGEGSGDLANLADADGFLELPPDQKDFKAGEIFPVLPYRSGF